MRRMLQKPILYILLVGISLSLFAACEAEDAEEVAAPTAVTIKVDGREITIENAEDKSVQELLDEAGIQVNEGDEISVAPDQILTGNLTIQLLRRCTVTVMNAVKKTQCSVVIVGGTVADAIAAAGMELGDDQTVNFDLDKTLENEMGIVISEKKEEKTQTDKSPSSDTSKPSTSKPSTSKPSTSKPSSSKPSATKPKPVAPTTKPAPKPTTPKKTVVSVVRYDDCDGSGHGVKVITYSDGTQEEVPY